MPEQLAFELVCTLFANSEELMDVSPVARDMRVENLDKVTAVPLHPGTVRYAEAVALYREALERRVERYGQRHPAVASAGNNLGSLLMNLKQEAEAEVVLREVLERFGQRGRGKGPRLSGH